MGLLGIRSNTTVSKRVLDAAPDLLAIGAYCIGTNQIDIAAAARRGIAVFNAPFSNTRSVVELALAEIIALTRRLTERDRAMHEGIWQKSASGAHEVRGRRLGIVGYGNIGTQLSVLAENLGMQVSFFDTADKLTLGNARRCESMEELLTSADVVTLHVDGRQQIQRIGHRNTLSRGDHDARRRTEGGCVKPAEAPARSCTPSPVPGGCDLDPVDPSREDRPAKNRAMTTPTSAPRGEDPPKSVDVNQAITVEMGRKKSTESRSRHRPATSATVSARHKWRPKQLAVGHK